MTDANLADLFANGTSATHTSVTYTGNINGFSQTLTGTFDITALTANTFSIAATNVGLTRSDGLAELSGATATFNLSSTGFSGTISNTGSFALGSVGSLSMSLSALTLGWNTGSGDNNISIGATGSLTFASGQSLANGNFTFESSGSDVTVGVTGASVSIGSITSGMTTTPVVSVTNLSATMDLSTGGIKTSGSANISANFTSDAATFSGMFGVSIDTTSGSNDTNLEITGTGVSVSVGGFAITADVAIEQTSGNAAVVQASVSNVSVDIHNGTHHYVTMTTPTPASDGSSGYGAFFFQERRLLRRD